MPAPPDPKDGSGSFSSPGGSASLQAACGVNRQEPAVRPQPAPRARAGRGASRRGRRKLDGAPGAVPGARPPSGLGEGSRASGASGRGPGGGPRVRFLTRSDGEVSEPLVGRQGSRVSMRVARGSASQLPSHGRGIWPRDALKRVSRGLSRVEAGTLGSLDLCR